MCDPLPGDRQSFFARPMELLGLALGTASIGVHGEQPGRWLRKVLRDGLHRAAQEIWSVALTTYASTTLGRPATAGRIAGLAEATAVDLACTVPELDPGP
ncbi:hypothetical protein BCD48_43990 [Pseudofrankia sp. BMG5.36]|nr:hypothetical protein BCD48_43990 [Pseudofrankia sp. BMG5.36]